MVPATRHMRIPAPEIKGDEYVFYPIVRIGHWKPFGYEEDPNDPMILRPIPEQLIRLEEAKKHIKNYSLRDVAAWLSSVTGNKISHQGIKDRIKSDTSRNKETQNTKHLAKQLAWAYKKAKRLENTRLGPVDPTEKTIDEEILEIVGISKGETSQD